MFSASLVPSVCPKLRQFGDLPPTSVQSKFRQYLTTTFLVIFFFALLVLFPPVVPSFSRDSAVCPFVPTVCPFILSLLSLCMSLFCGLVHWLIDWFSGKAASFWSLRPSCPPSQDHSHVIRSTVNRLLEVCQRQRVRPKLNVTSSK